MKTYIIIIGAIMAFSVGCSQKTVPRQGETIAAASNDTVRIANDSLEYEIIIIDPGFNSWLATRARQRGYYSLSYLENKNGFWVTEWNTRAMDPQRWNGMYPMPIDYNRNIDYGYEVNFLLYNYLVYFQLSNNQRLGGIVPDP